MPSDMETLGDLPNVQDKSETVADMDNQVEIKDEEKLDKVEEEVDVDTTMQDKEVSEKGELEEKGEDSHDESMQSEIDEASKKQAPKERSGSSSKDPVTPSERPTRERKIVKRYTESSSARSSTNKSLSIEKGRGTVLKDIPNVAFKLSKRKPDENLHLLHSILFGKKAKAHNLKKNIGMFSGYMWVGNEYEKQRAKVREKLDKCVKEKLMDFCDVLNIPIIKATIKKEDLCTKLLEFLESPYATTENLLSEKEKKGNKRKGKVTGGKTTESSHSVAETPAKKQKRNSQVGEKRKRSSKVEEGDKVEPLGNGEDAKDDDDNAESDTTPIVESDQEELKSEPEEDESKNLTPAGKNSSKKNADDSKTEDSSKSVKEDNPPKSVESTKKSSKATLKKYKVEEENEKDQSLETKEKGSRTKKSSSKKTKVEEENKKGESSPAKEKAPNKKKQTKKGNSKVKSESEKGKSSRKENTKVEKESVKDESSLAKEKGQKESSKVEEEIAKDKSVSAEEKAPRKKKSSTEKEKVEAQSEKDESSSSKTKTSSKKQPSSSTTKVPEKDPEKGKKNKKAATKEPSREELHAVTVDILKEVDFNTATLSDIVKQLGTHFGVDLSNRKAEVKDIIADVIRSMTDDEESDESDGEDDNKVA